MSKTSDHKYSTSTGGAIGCHYGEIFLYVLVLGLPLFFYNFTLVERKFTVLLDHGAFLLQYRLNFNEAVLYVLISTLVMLLFLLTVTTLLTCLLKRLGRHAAAIGAFIVSITLFLAVTAEFQVYRYFKDGMNMALLKGLGGGDWRSAVGYIEDELIGLLPLIIAGVLFGILGIWGLRRYGSVVSEWLVNVPWVGSVNSFKGLLGFNIAFCLSTLLVFVLSPGLDKALSRFIIYRLYKLPAIHLTDFDGDGYSMMSRPNDQQLFDDSQYPYAPEIKGNGIDENNAGGDLKSILWKRQPLHWKKAELQPMNVLVIVIESARFDLLDTNINGQPVMPVLDTTPGQSLWAFSHVSFTTPSVVAILNGVLNQNVSGQPLITTFKRLGYRTGVFSGQDETFGNKAGLAKMYDADSFRDSSTEDIEARMYSATTPASLKMPATVMNQRFMEWLDSEEQAHPFFVYVNWQETHFPYHFRGAKTQLVDQPIPRGEIQQENQKWLRQTYMNAARAVDDAFATVRESLISRGLWNNTLVLVVGDHGEELFDNGYLGHGTNLSFEQNMTLLKLINSDWIVPMKIVGLSDISRIIYNSLVRDQAKLAPLMDEIIGYVGTMEKPMQIGLVRENGIVKYDFYKDIWSIQTEPGKDFEMIVADDKVIHLWESYLIKNSAKQK